MVSLYEYPDLYDLIADQVAPTGLQLVERFGDFEGAPFQSDSANQVCICSSVDD